MTENNDMKWFERDELPRAVIDQDGDIWVLNTEKRLYGLIVDNSDKHWFDCTGKELETDQEYGPCTPLVPETEHKEPLPVDALTVPAGELKRAFELRMGEHAKRIVDSYKYHPEDAVKAGDMARLALAINPNVHVTWALTPVRDGETDE